MSSFEAYPGIWLRGQPVPNDLSTLMHDCSGTECSFCSWRRDNPIELGWERLLEDSEPLCRVDLTCSQVENPYRELSTQQTADFLAGFDEDVLFPRIDDEFEQVLSQYDSASTIQPILTCATELPAVTTVTTVVNTTIVTTASQTSCVVSPAAQCYSYTCCLHFYTLRFTKRN